MPQMTLHKSKVYYEIYSSHQTNAESIVLIHGFGLDSSIWRLMLPYLQDRYRILIYDLRGHGQSEHGGLMLTWDQLSEDLYELTSTLGITSFHLVGYGFGAHLAAHFTSRHSSKVITLIMLSPFQNLIRMYTTLETGHPELDHYFRVLSSFPNHLYVQLSKMTQTSPLKQSLVQVQVPALFISGSHDSAETTDFNMEQLTQLTIPNASFLLVLEQPRTTAEWIDFYIRFKVPMMNVTLMNRFEVRVGGALVTTGWDLRHAKRLLIYLILNPITTTEEICAALFPNVPISRASNNLKVYLKHLNTLLQIKSVAFPCLRLSRGTVQLQYKVKCDLIDYHEAVRQAYYENNEETRFNMCESLLDHSVYTLIPGIYDEWLIRMQEQIEHRVIQLNRWMANKYMNGGTIDKALQYWINILNYLPNDEDTYNQIIHLYGVLNHSSEQQLWIQRKARFID